MNYLRLNRVALIAVLLGLVLAACGGDDDSPKVVNHDDQSRFSLGDEAPAFTLPTANGGTVSLADYEGEQVLLFFHMAVG